MQRSSIRIRKTDQERVRDMAARMGISQEKFISRILRRVEVNEESGKATLQLKPDPHEQMMEELHKIKRMLTWLIIMLGQLTEEDFDNPDFKIELLEVYGDRRKYSEKYRN